jgi:chemotaxis protein MotB
VSRRRKHEDHVNHERWLVSYADFVTLLFALFVVLFASSHHDKKTIETVSSAVRNGFQEMGSFSSSDGAPDLSPSDMAKTAHASVAKNGAACIDVVELQRKLREALGKEIHDRRLPCG